MTSAGPTAANGAGAPGRRYRGKVRDFDEAVGLGFVDTAEESPSGGGRLRFHCTQIADGSRSIAAGTEVTFTVIPGRGGAWEAGDLRRVGAE